MASGTQLPNSGMTTTLKVRRVKALPEGPGSVVYFATPHLAVVADRPQGGGGGSGSGATIDICKCVQTQYQWY